MDFSETKSFAFCSQAEFGDVVGLRAGIVYGIITAPVFRGCSALQGNSSAANKDAEGAILK